MSKSKTPLSIVIGYFGNQAKLGALIGCSQSTVAGWLSAGQVPFWRISKIVTAAAQLIPPVHLTPNDFFDLPAEHPPVREAAAPDRLTATGIPTLLDFDTRALLDSLSRNNRAVTDKDPPVSVRILRQQGWLGENGRLTNDGHQAEDDFRRKGGLPEQVPA